MKKRIFVLLLAVLMIVPCVAACTSSGNDGDDTTTVGQQDNTTVPGGEQQGPVADIIYTDGDGYEVDDILMHHSDLNFNDAVINILAWKDHTMQEFESSSETLTGDIVDDALFKRNDAVENRLGVQLSYTYEKGNGDNMTQFMKLVETNSIEDEANKYHIVAGYSRTAPKLGLQGYNADLFELEYINTSKPWWPESLVEQVAIGDSLMFCSGDISTNLLWMMQATFFNKELITTYGLEDPYELVANGQWTIDKLISMCENKADLGTDGTKQRTDVYGYTSYETNIDDFGISCDIICVDVNAEGLLELSGDYESQRVSDCVAKIRNWLASDDVWHEDDTKARTVFFEERAIFTNDRLFIIAGKDNATSSVKIEFEYGVIPNPKYNEDQDNYITNLGAPFTTYMIPGYTSADNQNMAAAVLEVMGSESYRKVSPQVFEVVMKVKYNVNDGEDTNSEMFDTIKENIHFDPSRIYMIGGSTSWASSGFRRVILGGDGAWASAYKGNVESIKADIKTINDTLSNKD